MEETKNCHENQQSTARKRRIKRNQEVEKGGQALENPRKKTKKKTEENLNTKNNQKNKEMTKNIKPWKNTRKAKK